MTPGASFKVAEIIKPVLKSISESEPDINKLQKCTKLLATKYSFSHSHSCCHTTKVKCCKQFNFLLGVTCKHCSSKVQNSFRSSTHNSKKISPNILVWHQAGLQQLKSIGVSLANSCRREQFSKCSKALERRQTADTHTHTHSRSSPEF